MAACFESWSALFGSECQSVVAALIFFLGIAGTGLYYLVPWIWRHTLLKHSIHLQFVDHPPPNHSRHNFLLPYCLPIGDFRLCCLVQSLNGFSPAKVNFRFLNDDHSNVSASIIEIVKLEECDCDPKSFESTIFDTVGGIDGLYKDRTPAMAKGEGRYFWITARATQAWTGRLSARMQNGVGFRTYGRRSVTVSESPNSSLLIKASSFIPLWQAAEQLYQIARGIKGGLKRIEDTCSEWRTGKIETGSPEDILDYMATYIVFCLRIPLSGRRVPSYVIECIAWDDIRPCKFAGGASRLENPFNKAMYFTDLTLSSEDVTDLLGDFEMDSGFYGEN